MEYINKYGTIQQPESYAINPQFIVEEIYEENDYVNFKGEIGYLNTNTKKIPDTELTISNYDGINFHLKYNKMNNIIEMTQNFRTTTCEKDEYEKFSNIFFYNKQIKNFNDGIHLPYFRLPRTKDCVLIPHFIKSLWKYDDMPKISILIKENF